PRRQGEAPVLLDEHCDRGDHAMKTARRSAKVELVNKSTGGMFRSPRAGAARGGEHDGTTAAPGQSYLGPVPIADARIICIAVRINLRGTKEGQIHAAPGAQIIKILVGKYRSGTLRQHGIRTGYGNERRIRVHASCD